MDKLITALDNKYINKKLRELNKYEIKYDDILYQEGIFEILEKEEIDIILLSEILKGPYNIKELINKIKEKNNKIEIIIILEKKNEELENFLKEKNINNYFYNNQLLIEDFKNKKIISKKINNNNIEEIKNNILKNKNKINIKNNIYNLKNNCEKLLKNKNNKKYIFSFCGNDSFEKSIFILFFSLILKNKKILNIDLDFLNSNINTLFGVEKFPNKNNLKLKNNIIKINNNIDYLSGLEEIIKNNYEEIILKINKLKNNYDYIFINLSSITNLKLTKKILEKSDYNICIFNNKENDIIFNNNLLKIYNNEWGIKKEKFICFFNTENNNDLILFLKNYQIKNNLKNNYKYFNINNNYKNIIFNLNLEKYKINKKLKNKYKNLLKLVK